MPFDELLQLPLAHFVQHLQARVFFAAQHPNVMQQGGDSQVDQSDQRKFQPHSQRDRQQGGPERMVQNLGQRPGVFAQHVLEAVNRHRHFRVGKYLIHYPFDLIQQFG